MALLLLGERFLARGGYFVEDGDDVSTCERIERALEEARKELDKYKENRPEHCKRPLLGVSVDDPFPDDDECNTEAIAFWEHFIGRFERLKMANGCP